MSSYDLVVIGSGPGGYVAAIRASQLGLRTAVIEKDPAPGGTCLHRGCIPTKALLHSASVLEQVRHAASLGIDVALDGATGQAGESPAEVRATIDLTRTKAYRRRVIDKNAKGIEFLFKKNGVDLHRGVGRLLAPGKVEVVDQAGESVKLDSKFVLLATGSVPRDLPFLATDGKRVLSSDHLLELETLPESLVVLGAGAVGVEFASIFHAFGSKVTIVEMLPRILPFEDEDASKELARSFRRRGIDIRTDTKVAAVDTSGELLEIQFAENDAKPLQCETLLVAIGRRAVLENIGLEEVGVAVDGGFVRVDEWMRTSVPGVYAIGDIVDTPLLAHMASAEGILAVEHMAGSPEARPIDYDRVPAATYCEPEVASVGLTEQQARDRGYEVATGRFPFTALGKAAILGKTEGFVKVVRETRHDQVLGVHLVGAHATDLIAEACLALEIEATTHELFHTIHAHPTLSEAMAEAALAASGRAIHA